MEPISTDMLSGKINLINSRINIGLALWPSSDVFRDLAMWYIFAYETVYDKDKCHLETY